MLSKEILTQETADKLLASFTQRTIPVQLLASSGTGASKFVHMLNTTSLSLILQQLKKTQQQVELLKLSNDPTMQYFIHSVKYYANWNETDLVLLDKSLPPELLNDPSKMFGSLDRGSIEDYLDMWFDTSSPMFIIDELNRVIDSVLEKYKDEPVAYNETLYNNRTRIGVWAMLPVDNTKTMRRLEKDILRPYFARKGFGYFTVYRETLDNAGLEGKEDLNKYVNSRMSLYNDIEKYPNGVVVGHPNWGYAARSMSEPRLDVALNFRNSENPQDYDRCMTGGFGNITLDNKNKLIGFKIHGGFNNTETDWLHNQENYVRQLFTENRKANSETTITGPWLRGVNVFTRCPGDATPTLLAESELKRTLADSKSVLEQAKRVNLESSLWSDKLHILQKLVILRGKKHVEKLFKKVKRKRQGTEDSADSSDPTPLSEENKMKTLYMNILELLMGANSRLVGYAFEHNLTSIVDVVEHICNNPDTSYAEAIHETIGITSNEYLELLKVEDGLPTVEMDHILNATVSEII